MSIKGQRRSLTLAKGHLVFKFKCYFSQKLLGLFETKYSVKFMGAWE